MLFHVCREGGGGQYFETFSRSSDDLKFYPSLKKQIGDDSDCHYINDQNTLQIQIFSRSWL